MFHVKQFENVPRETLFASEKCYREFCDGCEKTLEKKSIMCYTIGGWQENKIKEMSDYIWAKLYRLPIKKAALEKPPRR